jgi:hypothetical protein
MRVRPFALAAVLIGLAGGANAFPIPPCAGPAVSARSIFGAGGAADPFELTFAEILLENEARGGRVAYCLSDARMSNGRNGLSFGFNQYDLASNPAAKARLAEILGKVAAAPRPPISRADVARVARGGLSERTVDLRASRDRETLALIGTVNTALSTSEVARAEIDRDFVTSLRATVVDAGTRIDTIADTVGARTLLQRDDLARLILLDYENFFGRFGPQYRGFLEGRPQNLNGGRVTVAIERDASVTDLIAFYLSGKQGAGKNRDERAECLRRINTVIRLYGADRPIALSPRDRTYLTKTLAPMLDDPDYPFVRTNTARGVYGALTKLIASAGQPAG